LETFCRTFIISEIWLKLIGTAAYFPSNPSIELLSLSHKYALAVTADQCTQYITIGQTLLEGYKGTAFNVYYVLNAFTLILIPWTLFAILLTRKFYPLGYIV